MSHEGPTARLRSGPTLCPGTLTMLEGGGRFRVTLDGGEVVLCYLARRARRVRWAAGDRVMIERYGADRVARIVGLATA